jgi:hypothetical protein
MYDDINLLRVLMPIYARLLERDKEKRNKIVAFVWCRRQHKFQNKNVSATPTQRNRNDQTLSIRNTSQTMRAEITCQLATYPWKNRRQWIKKNVQNGVYRITGLQLLIYDSDKFPFRQQNVLPCQQVKRDHKQIPEH